MMLAFSAFVALPVNARAPNLEDDGVTVGEEFKAIIAEANGIICP